MIKGKYTKGFTLVELLVVIAIIAILAGAMFMVINPAKLMAKTRDAKRISEITQINKAIASALADGKIALGAYGVNATDATTTVLGAGWVQFTLPVGTTVGLGDYLAVLPRDPVKATQNGINYYYYFASTTTAWELNAIMESPDSAGTATNDGGSANTCATTAPAGNLCRYEVGTLLTII